MKTGLGAMLVSLVLTPLLGCATEMKMRAEDLRNLGPDEGLVLGSVLIGGGKDILGRTSWDLVVNKYRERAWGNEHADYTIEATRDGDEVVFLTKMPAGNYAFDRLVQSGLSSAELLIGIPFEVQAGKTVYVGRVLVQFPPGLIDALTKVEVQVEDDKQATVDRAREEFGVSLSDVVTDIRVTEPRLRSLSP
jgi:hypothetical protein